MSVRDKLPWTPRKTGTLGEIEEQLILLEKEFDKLKHFV
jgi:hypothetical protein